MNKKSQAEYNWVFIIIAGTIILGFFVMFGVKYIDLQTQKENAVLTGMVYNSLYALQKSGFTTETDIELFTNKEVIFICNKFTIGNFISKTLSNEFVFSPREMNTNKINIWMRSWDFPFRIANFFYLSSPEYTYYIVYDSDTEDFVRGLNFPKNFNIKITGADVNARNVIYFKDSSKGVSIPAQEKGFLKIDGEEYPYFGLAMLYGAIFTEDYECLLDKSLKKYKVMVDIYEKKADMLFTLKPQCNYDRIKRTLSKLGMAIDDRDYDKIFELSEKIDDQNKDIVGANCKPLF